MICLYILELNPLSVASFTIIFSQSEGCLPIFVFLNFAVQKPLSLMFQAKAGLNETGEEWTLH